MALRTETAAMWLRPCREDSIQITAAHKTFLHCQICPSYARLFPSMVPELTLSKVNCLLELATKFTLPDPTHIGGFILM